MPVNEIPVTTSTMTFMGSNANNTFAFTGQLWHLQFTMTNPYNNYSVEINDDYNLNRGIYYGYGGTDTINMTTMGDALFIRNGEGNQTVFDVERFIANDAGDIINLADPTIVYGNTTIQGGAGDDILWGNSGADNIQGSYGDDWIDGGPGNDILSGGYGTNVMFGGTGSDNYIETVGNQNNPVHQTIYEDNTAEINIITFNQFYFGSDLTFVQDGLDLKIVVSPSETFLIINQFLSDVSGIDQLVNYEGTFNLRDIKFLTTEGNDYTIATLHDDVVNGLGGNDRLYGRTGNDVIDGGEGNDTIDGGEGSDWLLGGAGNDTLYYNVDEFWKDAGVYHYNDDGKVDAKFRLDGQNMTHDVFDGGDGHDVLIMTGGDDVLAFEDPYNNPLPDGALETYKGLRIIDIEEIHAGAGDDVINLSSAEYAYGDVVLYGDEGNDLLWSSSGNDVLYGGAGNDELRGGAGNDKLIIGAGQDVAFGGSGADQFILYGVDKQTDVIHGFELNLKGGDVLDISNILEDDFKDGKDLYSILSIVYDKDNNAVLMADGKAVGVGEEQVALVTFADTPKFTLADLLANHAIVTDSEPLKVEALA